MLYANTTALTIDTRSTVADSDDPAPEPLPSVPHSLVAYMWEKCSYSPKEVRLASKSSECHLGGCMPTLRKQALFSDEACLGLFGRCAHGYPPLQPFSTSCTGRLHLTARGNIPSQAFGITTNRIKCAGSHSSFAVCLSHELRPRPIAR